MALWIIGSLVVLVALLIPVLAIVLDSPAVHRLVEARRALSSDEVMALTKRVQTLEDEVDDLSAATRQLRDETQFLQRLLEESTRSPTQLPPQS